MRSLDGYLRIIENEESGFVLAKGLKPKNYKISTLSKVKEWEARILVGNSLGENKKIGDWDSVGYVMINLKTNEIVPIARADEHNTGYDMMHDIHLPNVNEYFPIYDGRNCVYSKQNAKNMIIAAKKWLKWGGPDCPVSGSSELTGLYGNLSDLVNHGLQLMPQPNKISIVGERVIKAFHMLGQLCTKYEMVSRAGRPVEALEKTIFVLQKPLPKM